MEMKKVDVAIIGAGVTGCSIARELSRYSLDTVVLERDSDVCEGTSKANSGIVHAGFDALPGTLKARMNVMGSKIMPLLSKELDFSYRQNGSMVLCFENKDIIKLEELADRGRANGVDGIVVLTGEEARAQEPSLSEHVVAALFAPSGGIVCPFGLTIAMAENAAANGVKFYLNSEVNRISKSNERFMIYTSKETIEARLVINAAGVYADRIHAMICMDSINITARRGEYCLFDKKVGKLINSTIFQLPGAYGKGILVTPTVHGNLLAGPTADDTPDKEELYTTTDGLARVLKTAGRSINEVPTRQIITSFAGLRAHSDTDDFIIKESSQEGFIDVAGIESPGLSAAPAIGRYVADMVAAKLRPADNKSFNPRRKGIPSMALASTEEKQKLIDMNPLYANVVCRCELVTEGEIVDAIKRPVGATTLDGVKRRTRAGMGRCQAGFCSPKTLEILARELGVDITEITKHGEGSSFLTEHK